MCVLIYILINPWAGQGAGAQVKSVIRGDVGGYKQNSLKIS